MNVISLCSGIGGLGYTDPMPKGQYDRAASKWTPPPRKDYPPELVEAVRSAYVDLEMTIAEVAEHLDTTSKVIWRLMQRHNIEARKAAKRNQAGPLNDSWKGDRASYSGFHARVRRERGSPTECSECHRSGVLIDWANLTGNYGDVNDYAAMCRWCHRKYDAVRPTGSKRAVELRYSEKSQQ